MTEEDGLNNDAPSFFELLEESASNAKLVDITYDEIDVTLSRGSSVEGGKDRICKYLTESHNSKENAAFLKDEFGWSGSSVRF